MSSRIDREQLNEIALALAKFLLVVAVIAAWVLFKVYVLDYGGGDGPAAPPGTPGP